MSALRQEGRRRPSQPDKLLPQHSRSGRKFKAVTCVTSVRSGHSQGSEPILIGSPWMPTSQGRA